MLLLISNAGVPLQAACSVVTAAGLKEWMFAGTWLRNCTTNQNCSSNCDLVLGLMCLFFCPLPPWCCAHAKALTSELLCLPLSPTALRPLCSATLHMRHAPPITMQGLCSRLYTSGLKSQDQCTCCLLGQSAASWSFLTQLLPSTYCAPQTTAIATYMTRGWWLR